MSNLTTDQISELFNSASDNVAMINKLAAISSLTDVQKARIERNVLHLERMKTIKTVNDETGEDTDTSIWTTEDFTAIDAAITLGKTKY
tara:strand:+ start:1131 stop:1397 length:267 start_codon:yes stop_codon:yes gene_type:complete